MHNHIKHIVIMFIFFILNIVAFVNMHFKCLSWVLTMKPGNYNHAAFIQALPVFLHHSVTPHSTLQSLLSFLLYEQQLLSVTLQALSVFNIYDEFIWPGLPNMLKISQLVKFHHHPVLTLSSITVHNISTCAF